MAMLNIPSFVDDPSYRYKMPRLVSRKEGRGNGSKTGILNMGDLARALKRDPVYITKFIGYEVGAQAAYTNKENEGERVVVNGHHDTPVFQSLVDKFIERYVLCIGCHLPEIDMVVRKGIIVAQCKACGWVGELDNQHKLAGYICKNPPGTGIGFDGEGGGGKKSREERQKERAEKSKKKKDDGDDEGEDEEEQEEKKEKKEKKDKKDKKDKKEKKTKDKEADDDDDDADDDEVKVKKDKKDKKDRKDKKDKKEKKDKKDKKEKKENKSKAKEEDSDEEEAASKDGSDSEDGNELKYADEDTKDIVKDITEFVKNKGKGLTVESMFEEVRAQQVTKVFDNKLRMYIVVSALFPGGSMDDKGVTSQKAYLKHFSKNGNMSFADWIWGVEAYLDSNPSALKKYPLALKALYDEDLADEKDILAYYKGDQDSPGFEQAKKFSAKFIEWLETADESGSADDEDSDESD